MPFEPDRDTGFIPDEVGGLPDADQGGFVPDIPVPAAFLIAAGRELASPVRAISRRPPPTWSALGGPLGMYLASRAVPERPLTPEELRREAFVSEAARAHPIATGLGTMAGFIPSLMVGGLATKPLRALPWLQRLSAAGKLGQLGEEALLAGAQGAAAETLQGRPEHALQTGVSFAPFSVAGLVPRRGLGAALRRGLVGAGAVGATSAAMAPPGERLHAGAFGAGAGAFGGALTRPFPGRLVPTAPRSSGIPPESYLMSPRLAFPEEFTPQVAEVAAREAAALVQQQPPLNPSLRTAIEIALERPIRGPLELPNVTPSMFPEGTFYRPPANPAIEYPLGRVPRTRTTEGGFVALPEEEPLREAGRTLAKAGVNPSLPPETQDRLTRITEALREAKPVRRQQEAIYRKGRAEKMATALSVRESGAAGEQGFYRELGALKGKLERAEYESIRSRINQEDVNALADALNTLPFWDSITAKGGFVKMLDGLVPTEGELALLRKAFGPSVVDALQARRGFFFKLAQAGVDFLSSMRMMSAGFGDMSFGLRQAVFTLPRHPVVWQRAWRSAFKQYFSPRFYEASQRQIAERPNAPLYEEYGLQLTGMKGLREEPFREVGPMRIPGLRVGIRAAERAYTGMGNRIRADLFDHLVRVGETLKLNETEMAEHLASAANAVNTMTGRGTLRVPLVSRLAGSERLERAAGTANAMLFSPRLLASRLNLLDPRYYLQLAPAVRKEVAQSALAFLAGGSATVGLAKVLGFDVGTEMRSADFGKIKLGNTRFDIWGGFQQPIRFLAQMVSGEAISSTTGRKITLGEGYRPLTRLELVGRFGRSKLSPAISLLSEWLEGRTFSGEEFRLLPELIERFVPMFLSDVHEVLQEPGNEWLAPVVGPYGFFGGGTQTYGRMIPTVRTTPSGRETLQFRTPPGIGESIVNFFTGQPVSNVPTRYHQPLEQARQTETKHQRLVDAAKERVLRTGKPEFIEGTRVWMENGVVKTRTFGRRSPAQAYEQLSGRRLRR